MQNNVTHESSLRFFLFLVLSGSATARDEASKDEDLVLGLLVAILNVWRRKLLELYNTSCTPTVIAEAVNVCELVATLN